MGEGRRIPAGSSFSQRLVVWEKPIRQQVDAWDVPTLLLSYSSGRTLPRPFLISERRRFSRSRLSLAAVEGRVA